jgi:hypothetical protein
MRRVLAVLLAGMAAACLPAWAARLFTDGFEVGDLAPLWQVGLADGTLDIQGTTKRSGNYALRALQGGTAGKNWAQTGHRWLRGTANTIFGRAYFRAQQFPGTFPATFYAMSTGNSSASGGGVISVRLISGPKLQLVNSITGSTADGSTTLSTNTWYRIEVKCVVEDIGGSAELMLDGNLEASISNEDTYDGTTYARLRLGVQTTGISNYEMYFDDVAMGDATGTDFTGYPGEGRIFAAKPNGQTSAGWTIAGSSPAATNWEGVDETPTAQPNDGTDYNEATSQVTDRLTMENVPSEAPADAVFTLMQFYGRVGSNGTTGTRSMKWSVWNEGGTQTKSAVVSAAINGWRTASDVNSEVFAVSLAGKTKANLDSYDIGYLVDTSGTNPRRVTTLWVNVEWKDAPPPSARRRVVIVRH